MSLVDLINQSSADQLTTVTQKSDSLGKEDFLQLLVAQMKNQDPLDPLKNEDFIAQLAQFNSLEQMMNLNKNFEQLNAMQMLTQSAALIGKGVAWYDADGNVQSGGVSSVEIISGIPTLMVGDQQVAVSDIFAITNL
ncbi:MAG: flagellar hook capping FlgD N-terminal domain-containing protein [bacterium]